MTVLIPDGLHTHGVIPAKAGIHPEMSPYLTIAGWAPAFAGVTSSLRLALETTA